MKILNVSKISFSIISFLVFALSPLSLASAYLEADQTSTYGSWDETTKTPITSFDLKLYDTDNGIEELNIKAKEDKKPINHSSLYSSTGIEIELKLKVFDSQTGSNYTINLPHGNNATSLSYGTDYIIDSSKQIRIANADLELPEDDSGGDLGVFNVDNNDKIKILGTYLSQEKKNVIKAKIDTELKKDDLDIDFEKESFEEEAKIFISIVVPLINNNTNESKQVIAKIALQNGNMTFESGLGTQGVGNDSISGLTEEKGAPQGTGFEGHGVKIPRRDTFKGISTETNFENFIAGITNFILTFVAVIAVIMLVYGGYLWVTDQGDESNAEKAKKIIASSVIGILIIISAYTIINTVIGLEGNMDTGCEIGIDGNVNLDCTFETDLISPGISGAEGTIPQAIGQGVGGIAGAVLGNELGGDTGGIVGGLLGSMAGGILGGLFGP